MFSRSRLADRRNALLRRVPWITWPTPTFDSMSPTTLLSAGGETVTITGTGFRVPDGSGGYLGNVLQVLIGASYEGTSVTIVSDTSLTFVTPAMVAGTYSMWLRSNGGDGHGGVKTVAGGFRILVETGDVLLAETSDALRTE